MEYFFDFADSVEYDMQQAQRDFEDSLRESAKEFEKPLYRASAGQGAYNDTYTSDSITMGEEGFETAFSLYSLILLYTPLSVISRGWAISNAEAVAIARVPPMGVLKKPWQNGDQRLCGCFLGHLDRVPLQGL